ncbi:vitamin K-dependent gamma-carboxylase-like [Lineus longissimus]|uniref:vitamin K-dependent gamma-carboxylase-like n=1 Tax=Lineus longissimus TaxID=88925 RepID=UPI002B4F4516
MATGGDDKRGHIVTEKGRMRSVFGFDFSDFQSWLSLNQWLHAPRHPSNLAALRVAFGLLMVIDVFTERGFPHAERRWGSTDECQFPLFDFLRPLPLPWMFVAYLALLAGALGIMFGFLYKLSCLVYMTIYWYIFLLDKVSWNNHSYLYGLISLQLLLIDANRSWSIDGLIWPKLRNSHVPSWNYGLLRFQIFIVYFIAGLKKLDFDWVTGYSMHSLSEHWVFMPFRSLIGKENTDLFVVHLGGLTIDLFTGFLLYFSKTRKLAFLFGGSFHLMNSRMFSIGMFPYTMLATMPIFSDTDWPARVMRKAPTWLRIFTPLDGEPQRNPHCLYSKEEIKPEEKHQTSSSQDKVGSDVLVHSHPKMYHSFMSALIIVYVTTQCILPYSHSITKGYNNWTNGLYGYSWDMMVHSWRTQHTRVSYKNKETGEVGFLNPEAWIYRRDRWTSHADMVKQYGVCVQERLRDYNLTNIELYIDVWKSMNKRFQQRMFDPRVDILSAEWHPLEETRWLFPLLTSLSDWREKLRLISKELSKTSNDTDIVFVADFPGLMLENYVQDDFGNTSLSVLKGEVVVEVLQDKKKTKNITLKEGDETKLPAGQFHNVHTVSTTPSCYMYVYVNTTHQKFEKKFIEFESKVNASTENGTKELTDATLLNDQLYPFYQKYQERLEYKRQRKSITAFQMFRYRLVNFLVGVHHSLVLSHVALTSIYSGEPMVEIIMATNVSTNLDGMKDNFQYWLGVEAVETILELPSREDL